MGWRQKLAGWIDPGRGISIDASAPVLAQPLQIPTLVQKFTTEDEPKVRDYPREQYSVFWEIIVGEKENYYTATIRLYDWDNGFLKAETFNEGTIAKLKHQVNGYILTQMPKYKRG